MQNVDPQHSLPRIIGAISNVEVMRHNPWTLDIPCLDIQHSSIVTKKSPILCEPLCLFCETLCLAGFQSRSFNNTEAVNVTYTGFRLPYTTP
jgi:hypothetical protein